MPENNEVFGKLKAQLANIDVEFEDFAELSAEVLAYVQAETGKMCEIEHKGTLVQSVLSFCMAIHLNYMLGRNMRHIACASAKAHYKMWSDICSGLGLLDENGNLKE